MASPTANWLRPSLRTACDRCYELKERCERASPLVGCNRCARLAQICSNARPVRPAGRRPRRREKSASTTSSILPSPAPASKAAQRPCQTDTRWRDLPGLPPEQKALLLFFLGQPGTLKSCVVSPGFSDAEQQSFAAPLPEAWPVLKDAYLACAGALRLLRPLSETEVDADAIVNLRHASCAMKTLRFLPVKSSQDAAVCLTLGTALAIFVYSAVGAGVSDICHYCLSRAAPFVEAALLDPDVEPLLSFLILLETMECFVHRRKPTLRIPLRQSKHVDRHLGLCVPLLRYFYDFCVISHSLAATTDASLMARLFQQLDGIQHAVAAWQPSQPDDLIQRFEAAEVIHLLAQARVYRLAALLVSHRLRYLFGQEDGQADLLSKEIMMELELARRTTKQSIRCVTLPFIIAAVEVREPSARVKTRQDVEEYVDQFTPAVQKATKIFLLRVWRERDVKTTCSWFDSAHKPCVVLDSIDATIFT
ncbi:MAG: hypothetical protein M1818_007066 [Claussenomyces sp. TS43310]|nr:MAG: hypothetical protein M1818_007066 [Claussenomyces sp. TS43310]